MRDSKLKKIAVFDSGLGGLTVVRAILDRFSGIEILYLADTANAPYGEKSPSKIREYCLDISNFFVKNYNIDALVVACNTATSAGIASLREKYPQLPIIGTEPAVKPAINLTKTNKIGVMATSATLAGDKYRTLVDTITKDSNIQRFEQACSGLVEKIEAGEVDTLETFEMLKSWLIPMRREGVDTIVLGCTHYPLASKAIKKVMGDSVTLIDAGEAIAKRLSSFLKEYDSCEKNRVKLFSTGDINKDAIKRILGEHLEIQKIEDLKGGVLGESR